MSLQTSPSASAENEQAWRRERRMLLSIIAVLFAGSLLGLGNLLLLSNPALGPALFGLQAALAVAFVLAWRRRPLAARILIPPVVLGFVCWGMVVGSGIHDPALSGFHTVVVLAGLLLGRRGALIFGALSLASISVLYRLETTGVIEVPLSSLSDPMDLVNIAALLSVTTGLVVVLIGDLKWSLARTRTHERALARSHSRLEDEAAERERLIRELEARNAELERFVYTVSHDLRTPLVTLGGYLGRVQRSLAESQGPSADLERARAAVDQLERILSEMLELTRAGRVRAPAEWFSLEAATERVMNLVGGRPEASEATVEAAPDAPLLFADRARFEQVLQNLLDNALKFSGDAPPRISLSAARQGDETTVTVTDSGIGIAPGDRQRVFELFERVDPGAEGTGIGLAIVQRIVASQGGRLWIEDNPEGRGVRLCFTLAGQPPPPGA